MKRLFYFAFGSNMYLPKMKFRVGHLGDVVVHSTHRLYGYKLLFNCGYKKYSFANIVPASPENFVEGVLYELNQKQIAELNHYECYPYNYEQQFFLLPDNNIGFAYVSVNPLMKTKALPVIDYLNTLIEGSFANKLYHTYNGLVKFKNEYYSLKKGNKYKLWNIQ